MELQLANYTRLFLTHTVDFGMFQNNITNFMGFSQSEKENTGPFLLSSEKLSYLPNRIAIVRSIMSIPGWPPLVLSYGGGGVFLSETP